LRQCGISDTVVMRISPGTYDTILNINYQIPGAGVVGMVIFEGGGSVPSSVVLRNANTSSVNYVVNLQGTKGVGLRNLKLKSNGTSYGRCLVVEGGSRDILVEGCELEGLVVSSTSTDYAVVYSSSSNNEHNVRLVGNKIRNGSYGIYWYGYSSTLLDSGVVMKGNDIRDFYYSGMYVYYQRGLLCEGNYVKTGTSYSSPYGIYGGYCDYSVFSRNRVVIPSYYGMYLYYCDGDASVRGRVENNFVVVGGTGTAYGIYMYYSTFYNVYHNSVRIGSTSATSGRALYHYYSNNVDYKNNIWANMGGGYSVYVSGGTFESNYNDLYTTGSVLGYYTSNQNNLAAWQSATGKDGNSISAHPEYFSLENLHTINPVLNNIGTPVGVLFDIDNEPRSLSNPDIGADEFTPLPYELQIVDITSPVTGCGLGVEPVVVRIKNNGTDTLPLNNMATITYRLNQNSPVTENLNIIIPPGQIRVFTFTTPVNLAATVNDTSFVLQVYVTEPSDIIRFNDTLKTNILSLIVPPSPLVNPVTIPYGTSTVVSATGTSNIYWFADPLLTQLLGQGNAYTTPVLYDTTYYYVVNSSEIRYRYTFDNNLQGWQSLTPCTYTTYSWQWNSAGGIGVAFAQDPSTNSSQLLLSPVMNVGGDTLLFYMRHKYNTESCCDKAYIAYRINGGAWQRLIPYQGTYTGSGSIAVDPIANCSSTSGGFFSGNSQNYINTYGKIPLNLTQATLQIGLIFYSDGSIAGDGWYVDEVEIKKPGCHSQPSVQVVYTSGTPLYDLTCLEIISPNSGIELSSQEQVKIKIKNLGTQPVGNFQVGYRINNTSPVFETYSATLNHGSESVYTFNQTANLSAFQTYQIKAFVSYSGDNVQVNDTASKSVTNSPLTYCTASATSPGYEDLTGITIGSVTYNNPAIGATYQNYDTLPPFILFNGFSYPISVRSGFPPGYSTQYSCWVNVFIDYNRDGDFEDAGELVFSSATQSQNTVSGTLVVPPQTYMGTTKLRVVLRESGNASNTGPCGTFTWGEVEDYRVLLMPKIPQDAGVVQIISPSPVEISQNQIPLKVKVKNFGTDTLFAIPVSYKLNNQNPVTFTISDVLPPDTTRQYTIGNIVPNYGTNQLCAYTVVVGDSNTFNDKTCMNLYGLPNIIFFADTNDNNSLLTTSGTLWQYGQPSATVINHAAVGQKCWVTNLTGNYPNNAESYLDLPLMNFLGIDTPHIVFYYWIHAEENYDGGFVQYSLDGVTWNSLGAINDAMGYNWFNSYITGTPGWSKNTNGWKLAYYRAAELSNRPYVKLRIGFKSNASNNFEGMAVDYFRILTPKANQDAGVVEIISPTDSTLSGSQVEVKVKIKNFGKNVLNSVSVRYKVSTGYPLQSTTWTGTLLPDHIAEVTFPNTYPGPSTSIPSYKLCAYTVVSNDPYKFNDTTCIMLQTYTNQGLSDDLYSMLKIYPNPVQNNVFIECPHELRVHSLVIYNMLGEKVDHVDWAFQDKFLLKVSLPVLPTGNYFIKLTTDKGIVKIPITVIQ
ncbi:MAG: GEVED domain-containing protein, partial [Bacteroidales bacterium]|nr:GEVED domain-containing protein [Bacteroidales bacterium]